MCVNFNQCNRCINFHCVDYSAHDGRFDQQIKNVFVSFQLYLVPLEGYDLCDLSRDMTKPTK